MNSSKLLVCLLWVGSLPALAQDVPFLESPESVVETMLELAEVTSKDRVYDLGSGDGRIVIAAAVERGASAVGIESDGELVELSRDRARQAGVEDRVEFHQADLFESDFSSASVVMVYLQPRANERLRPLLEQQLAPDTRVVSHRYEIPDWEALETVKVEGRRVFLYRVPGVKNRPRR